MARVGIYNGLSLCAIGRSNGGKTGYRVCKRLACCVVYADGGMVTNWKRNNEDITMAPSKRKSTGKRTVECRPNTEKDGRRTTKRKGEARAVAAVEGSRSLNGRRSTAKSVGNLTRHDSSDEEDEKDSRKGEHGMNFSDEETDGENANEAAVENHSDESQDEEEDDESGSEDEPEIVDKDDIPVGRSANKGRGDLVGKYLPRRLRTLQVDRI